MHRRLKKEFFEIFVIFCGYFFLSCLWAVAAEHRDVGLTQKGNRIEASIVPGASATSPTVRLIISRPLFLRNQPSRNGRIVAARDVVWNAEGFVGLQVIGIQIGIRLHIFPRK